MRAHRIAGEAAAATNPGTTGDGVRVFGCRRAGVCAVDTANIFSHGCRSF